jgi:hypothetical protein
MSETIVVMGPVYYTGRFPSTIPHDEHPTMLISDVTYITRNFVDHIGEHTMGENFFYGTGSYDHGLDERDRKLVKLHARLSLANASRNKMEITRLSKEIKRLGQGR